MAALMGLASGALKRRAADAGAQQQVAGRLFPFLAAVVVSAPFTQLHLANCCSRAKANKAGQLGRNLRLPINERQRAPKVIREPPASSSSSSCWPSGRRLACRSVIVAVTVAVIVGRPTKVFRSPAGRLMIFKVSRPLVGLVVLARPA